MNSGGVINIEDVNLQRKDLYSIYNSTFINNKAVYGAVISITNSKYELSAKLKFTLCQFTRNQAIY